jgi:ligand-binding sensor domain-containing protein
MLKKVLFLFFWIFSQHILFSQRYNFVNYSVEEGLPQSQIYSIYQDSQGYLWFGTYGGGLSRFDGINFENYNEERGLSCSFVRSIAEYENGTLLIGTDEGLFIFAHNQFIPYSYPKYLGRPAIRALLVDRQKNIWVGGMEFGLYKYTNGKVEKINTNQDGLGNNVNCLYADKQDRIWVGLDGGFCKIDPGGQKITSFKKFDGGAFTAVRCITEDKAGRIWLGSYIYGAAVYNGYKFQRYTTQDGLANNTVNSLWVDEKGAVWFGTSNGISQLKDDHFNTITSDEGLCGNTIVTSLEDGDHNLWFGSSGGGVSKFDNERFIHFPENETMGKLVYTIQQDNRGNMWFGTSNGGVTRFDGSSFEVYNAEYDFTDRKIKSIFCDEDSTYWFGTLGVGAYYYNGKDFINYSYKSGLCGNYITGIIKDQAGNIWFSSLDNGVGFFNPTTKNFYRYRKKDGLASERINTVAVDESGSIWAGTDNAGINKISFSNTDHTSISISTINQSKGLSTNNINSIICRKGKLYIGTSGGGINIMDASGKFTYWKKAQGLSSNIIYSLVFDNSGNLWAGSEKGIDKIVLNNDKIVRVFHFGKAEGFIGVENTMNSSCIDTAGNLWFGTINGANRYNPNFDQASTSLPKIHLTGVNIFFDKVEDTEYGKDYSSFEELSGNLILPYNKNHISFEFIGINYRNPDAVKYKWRLIGDDEKWSPELTRREATYSNLSPGKYTFELKACNENGIWNEKPVSFSFIIKPPYWTSPAFLIAVGGIILLFLSIVVISIIRRIKYKNREEKQRLEMSKNILELEQATSRLQMNPHFLFNSLNSIQGYIASNNTTEAKWYLSKFAKLMRLILDNAKEEFIPLRDEMYILENYMILERMRMNEKFDYTIICDASIDTDEVEIPPMIIQPFVENSILHGLKHKEGKGLIDIKFFMNDGVLTCEITDNGIGRQAATEMKNKSAADHKSSAITITEERLKRMEKDSKKEGSIKFLDLKDVNGEICGTKVIINIPT